MFQRSSQAELIRSSGGASLNFGCENLVDRVCFSATFDRHCGALSICSGFFDPPIDKRIACPYKFSKRSGKDSGRKIWPDLFAQLPALR
jgi:hypothetical protein